MLLNSVLIDLLEVAGILTVKYNGILLIEELMWISFSHKFLLVINTIIDYVLAVILRVRESHLVIIVLSPWISSDIRVLDKFVPR